MLKKINRKDHLGILFALVCFLVQGRLTAQERYLPKQLTEQERLMLGGIAPVAALSSGISSPPPAPLRNMAEWEEIQALTIAWQTYPDVLTEIVRHARLECPVYIICDDSVAVKNYLTNKSVPLSNIEYLQTASNSVWIRDYGMNSVYINGVDSLVLVDWIYNRPRPLDDAVPQAIADHCGLPLYTTTLAPNDLVNTGGNFMSDGLGTAFASELILEENQAGNPYGVSAKTSDEIDSIMKKFMGIERFIKMPTLPYDGIHHIDMHLKLLDEETLLVGQYPAGVADGPQIEANLQYILTNYLSPFGTPYKVVRVPMPPGSNGNYPDASPWWMAGEYRTYSNCVFVNKTLLVPIYDPQYDSTGLRILREVLPGYNVVGIDADAPIQASGAIHCITHSVGVQDPLHIVHQPLTSRVYQAGSYTIAADIRHRSGIASATLFYRTDTTQPYTATAMNLGFVGDTWFGEIPDLGSNTYIYYYIHAEAVSGKTQNRPIVAPTGYWRFFVADVMSSQNNPQAVVSEMKAAYPNPAQAITCVPIEASTSLQGELALYNIWGQKILVLHSGNFSAGTTNYFFDASELAAGFYSLSWQTSAGIQQQALIIR